MIDKIVNFLDQPKITASHLIVTVAVLMTALYNVYDRNIELARLQAELSAIKDGTFITRSADTRLTALESRAAIDSEWRDDVRRRLDRIETLLATRGAQ